TAGDRGSPIIETHRGPIPPLRLLSRDGRWRRTGPRERGAGARPQTATGPHPRRCTGWVREGSRVRRHSRGESRAPVLGTGGRGTLGGGRGADLRPLRTVRRLRAGGL